MGPKGKNRGGRVRQSGQNKPMSQMELRAMENWEGFIGKLENAVKSARRSASGPSNAYSKPSSVVKRMVYHYISIHIDRKSLRYIDFYLEEFEPYYPKKGDLKNQFYAPLHLISQSFDFLDKTEVARYANQLLYAWRHKVPVEYLVGFIFQSGGTAVINKAHIDDLKMERWFTDTSEYYSVEI